MKRRGGKRESAGRTESPALTKIMKEINQKHWRANHHYICLQTRVSRPCKRSIQFVNDSNLGSLTLLDLELKRIKQHNK